MKCLICRICGSSVGPKLMAIHLRAHHQVKFLDYVHQHIDDFSELSWRRCVICKTPTRKVGDKHPPTCSRECLAKYRKTLVGEKAPGFGKHVSDSTRMKLSNIKTEWFKTHNHPLLGKQHSDESKKKMSAAKIGLYDGSNNPMFGKKHRPESLKKMFVCRPMNSLETKVAKELERLGLKYTYQYFINVDGRCRSFDFKLKHQPIIIEADGDYWHGNPNTAHHCPSVKEVKENDRLKEKMAIARGYRVIRFWESDVVRDPTIIETRLLSEGIVSR